MPSNDLLQVTINANDGSNHIYISSDTSLNVLTLTLTNTTTTDLVFQQCDTTNCWIGALPADETGIYLLFNGLLSNTAIAGITTTAPGWSISNYSDNQCGNYLVFTPQSTITLAPNNSLSFTLQLPAVTGSANSGYLSCQYVNVLASSPISAGEQLYVMTVYPPRTDGSAAALLPIQFEFIGSNVVYNNGDDNVLSLRITNTSADPLVPLGKSSWGSTPPQFKLYFIQNNNSVPGSLLTDNQAVGLKINITQLYGNCLVVGDPTGTSPVFWTIEEDEGLSGADGTILGTGTSASINIGIGSLQTYVPLSTTMAILEYSGFPGYEDGQVTAEVQIKNAPPPDPIINQYFASTYIVNIRNTGTPFYIYCQVSNANSFTIYDGPSKLRTITSPDPNDLFSTAVNINQTTTFVIVVSNSAGKEVASSITVQVDTVPIGVIMMWSGYLSTVPNNWHVCDGTNNTPNLRDRFVMGASGDVNAGTIPNPPSGTVHYLNDMGGTTSHIHSVTTNPKGNNSTDPGGSHQHYMNFNGTRKVQDSSSSSDNTYFHGNASDTNSTWWYTGTDLSQYDGSHFHSLTIPALTGTTGSADTLPPYIALYYIMKIS